MATLENKIDSMFGTSDPATETDSNEQNTQSTTEVGEGEAASTDGRATQPAQRDTSERTQPNNGKEQPAQRQTAQGQQPAQRRLPANNNGDLVDPASGAIIAKAGNERRYYEAARNAGTEVQRMRADFDRVSAELGAFREAAQLPTQLGLQPVEVTNALHFMAHMKRNPVEAAQKVLTELRAAGYDIEGVGGGQMDMAALKQMVNEAVAPFRQDRESTLREQQVNADVDREINTFFSAFPWGQHQQTELNTILQADPTLSLREAGLMLQAYALQHGYDLNQPLRPQVLAAQNGEAPQQVPQRPNNARAPTAPPAVGNGNMVPNRSTPLGHDRSTRDIVREALREAGLDTSQL